VSAGTLLLNRGDVRELLSLDECIAAVEEAFRLHAAGKTLAPGVLGVHARGGGFHIKVAGLEKDGVFFAAKLNGNFPQNPAKYNLPSIQGVVFLSDGENGRPLALMDSMEITLLRTGAASAIAARYLSRADSTTATICGCGNQGRIQLESLLRVRKLEFVYAWDVDAARARDFAGEMSAKLKIPVQPVDEPAQGARRSDMVATCTPSREPILRAGDVGPGTFIAAVGADSSDKQELDPCLVGASKVVVDVLEQCAEIGELHHALENCCMTRERVHAELVDLVSGRRPGRTSDEEITIFDSTGTALEDVAAAVVVYRKALERKSAGHVDFAGSGRYKLVQENTEGDELTRARASLGGWRGPF